MFSGESNLPQPDTKAMGLDPSNMSTAEQARPLPVFWGTQKLGVTFITKAFGQHNYAVWAEQKDDILVGYNYHIQFAALVCAGPVDAIHEIWFDGESVWQSDGSFVRDGTWPDYIPITIANYGTYRFYWGTETQRIDARDGVAVGVNPTGDVFTRANHGFDAGDPVMFGGTTLPAGLREDVCYYVVNADTSTFQIARAPGGAAINLTDAGAAVTVHSPTQPTDAYAPFYLEDLARPWFNTKPETAVTINATANTVGLTAHGMLAGTAVRFSGTTLPAGIDADTVYYVTSALADTFQITTTPAGLPVDFSDTGTAVKVQQLDNEFHPAYRGQCYLVARDHFMGYNRTQVQQIEIKVTRHPAGAGKIGMAGAEDISVAAVLADALTDTRYGLGLPAATYNATDLAAATATLTTESLGISPVIDRAQPFDQFLLEMLGYVDGFYYAKPDGTISLGLNRGVECSGAIENPIVIDETCLTELPQVEVSGIHTTRNEIRVQFRNREIDFKDDLCAGHSAGTLQMVGSMAAETLQRPWVTLIAIADKMARAAAKHLALPEIKGTLTVRKSRLQGLELGDPFYLSYRQYFADSQYKMHCRVTELTVSDPFSPVVEIAFEQDHGYLNGEAWDGSAGYASPLAPPVTPPPIEHAMLLELPSTSYHWPDNDPRFVVLASRSHAMNTGMLFTWESAPDVFTPLTSGGRSFPPRVQIMATVSESATTITVHVISPFDAMPTEIQDPGPGRFDWLLVLDGADEIMAVIANPELQENGDYLLTVTRGALDTKPAAIEVETVNVGYVTRLAMLTGCAMPLRASLDVGDTVSVQIRAVIGRQASPAATALEVSATYRNRTARPWKPKGTVASWPSTWTDVTASLIFGWVESYRGGDMPAGPGGSLWVLDIRLPGDPFDIDNPKTGRRYEHVTSPMDRIMRATSNTVDCARLATALGARQSFVVRLYARDWETALNSLWWDEKTVTRL